VCSNESKSSKNHKTHIAIAALAYLVIAALADWGTLSVCAQAMQQNNSVEPESQKASSNEPVLTNNKESKQAIKQ
jgi:hypothetical protein